MENQEEKVSKEQILSAIKILRDVTIFMKVTPFVYAGLFLICMVCYMLFDDEIATLLDMLFYVSPITCFLFIRISFILKFCNWYRLQSTLPILPIFVVFVDNFVYEFGDTSAYINYAVTAIIFILSLINTYFVFIKK